MAADIGRWQVGYNLDFSTTVLQITTHNPDELAERVGADSTVGKQD